MCMHCVIEEEKLGLLKDVLQNEELITLVTYAVELGWRQHAK